MATAAAILLLATGLLALAGILLAVRAAGNERRALVALADRRGWSHTARGGETFARLAARVLPSEGVPVLHDTLSGPSAAGPFVVGRAAFRDQGDHRARERTVLHVRTAVPSPGLAIRPAERFLATPPGSNAQPDRFSRLFAVTAHDEAFAAQALDWDTCAFLAAPGRPVRIDWLGHDLLVAFPTAARTPLAIETLVTWGEQLARRIMPEPRPRPLAARVGNRAPERTALPAGIDPFMP